MTSVSIELSNRIQALVSKYKTSAGVFGFVWNPEDHCVYLDNPSKKGQQIEYRDKVFDALAWAKANNLIKPNNEKGLAAAASIGDPSDLQDCFFGAFVELADCMDMDKDKAIRTQDKGLAGSIITSVDYDILSQPIILGESVEAISPGVLLGFFDDVATPRLKGNWFDSTSGVEYFTNVPEGILPEPTKGVGSTVAIDVPKHAGGVEITERADMILGGTNIYNDLVTALGRKRLMRENGLVAAELENTTTVIAGVDFGLRAGTPPSSSNYPNDLWQTIIDSFAGGGGVFNGVASKNIAFNEYKNNDYNKGYQTPSLNVSGPDASGPAPGVDGVTWFRDNAILSATKLWAADRGRAGKNFRGPVRSFDLSSERTESRATYIKSYLQVKIVDQDFIREVTGVTA
jgi:hypothetical protein